MTATTDTRRSQPDAVPASTVLAWTTSPDKVTIIDVRSPAEFATAHIAGSYNMPLDLLGEHAAEMAARLDHKTVLVCQSGVRAEQARQHLDAVGMDDLYVLERGVPGFTAAGGTVVHGRRQWALERQVRLTAGLLVLSGLIASRRFPKAITLTGGIGAGLTVSALTNTCAMGRALSWLPFNRSQPTKTGRHYLEQLPTR